MEKRFKSLSLFEFQERFPDDDKCKEYLAELKWSNGYKCLKCNHSNYCNGHNAYGRQCTKCGYIESVTAGTLFHLCRFPLLKAFYIVYYVATSKKGIASTELSRKLELRQKNCWLFKQKVMKAMESSGNFPLDGSVEVDETYVGGQDDESLGRNEGKKKLVVIGIEKKGRGVSRMYGKVIDTAEKKNLKSFMIDNIHPQAHIKIDLWAGYKGLVKDFPNITHEKSAKKGKNFPQLHRTIMMFKSWLRGMHHSVTYLQAYINEYTYRFNRHKMKEGIFENLMTRMVGKPPFMYKMLINQ